MKKDILTVVMVGLAYSVMAFAYMHSTFPSKDVFDMQDKKISRILLQLDRIEIRLDRM